MTTKKPLRARANASPVRDVIDDVCRSINEFEAKLRAARPEVRWLYVEPDIPRDRVEAA